FSANLLLSDALRPSGATFSLLGWRWEEGRSPNVWPSPCGRAPPARYAGTVSALAPFSPTVRRWFEQTFDAPTTAQERGWATGASRKHHLIHAPPGSVTPITGVRPASRRSSRERRARGRRSRPSSGRSTARGTGTAFRCST